jgi:hypothetical protein
MSATVEQTLFALLKGLVSNRLYPLTAPVGTALPYGTYQQIGGESPSFLGAEVPSKQNGRFQLNFWAATDAAAASLALQAEAILLATTQVQATPLGAPAARYEDEAQPTPLYGREQDFSVWSDR